MYWFLIYFGVTMKIGKMLILCTITGLIAVPTVSAEKVYLQNPKSKVILDSMEKNYIISTFISKYFVT